MTQALPEPHRAESAGRRLRRWAIAGALLVPWLAHAEAAFDIGDLMRTLAQTRSGTATFVEKRIVSQLDHPLESSGRLSFDAPDTFVRETLKPRREKVAVVGNEMTLSQGSRSRTMALDAVPEAAIIMEAVRGTLTGNRTTLEQHFGATVSGNAQHWILDLVPRESRLRELVVSVRISGRHGQLHEVLVALADGDRSIMTIEPGAPVTSAPTPITSPASGASAVRAGSAG